MRHAPGETFGVGTPSCGTAGVFDAFGLTCRSPRECLMDAFLISTLVVAVAEIGDKTQLLALVLALRYHAPWAILAGITVATVANHALAGAAGHFLSALLTDEVLRWVLAVSFAGMAAWALVPDRVDDADAAHGRRFGPFLASTVAFFVVEIGDKTQVATVALAARFDAVIMVVLGTTLGMLLANAPVVLLGHLAGDRLRMDWIRAGAAALFAALALWVALFGV